MAESALAADLDPGTRGDRYQLVVHVDEEALQVEADGGVGTLEGVGDVSAETSRRLSCDAKVEMRPLSAERVFEHATAGGDGGAHDQRVAEGEGVEAEAKGP